MPDTLQEKFKKAQDQKSFDEIRILKAMTNEDRQHIDQLKLQCEKELATKQTLFDQSKDKLIQEREAELHDNRHKNLDLKLDDIRNPSQAREETRQQAENDVGHYHANDLNETREYHQTGIDNFYGFVEKKQEFLQQFNQCSHEYTQVHARVPDH